MDIYMDIDSINGIPFSAPPPLASQTIWTAGPTSQPGSSIGNGGKPGRWRSRRKRKRLVLPVVITGSNEAVSIMACPDSGSDENIISLEIVEHLDLKIYKPACTPRNFILANGKVVQEIGLVSARCSFGAGSPSDFLIFDTSFYVFKSLAVAVIMGSKFLEKTKTLSKYRGRMVEETSLGWQYLRVNSLDSPRKSIRCRVNDVEVCASADTGSDLDLVSPKFAKKWDTPIEPAFEIVQFADGSLGYISGVIDATFSLGNQNMGSSTTLDLEFHVLNTLSVEVLVGQDTIEMLDIFRSHLESLVDSPRRFKESDTNIIRHIGGLEHTLSDSWKAVKKWMRREGRPNKTGNGSKDFEAQLRLDDQRENARREAARAEIAALGGSARISAQAKESSRIQAFEDERERLLEGPLKQFLADNDGMNRAHKTEPTKPRNCSNPPPASAFPSDKPRHSRRSHKKTLILEGLSITIQI